MKARNVLYITLVCVVFLMLQGCAVKQPGVDDSRRNKLLPSITKKESLFLTYGEAVSQYKKVHVGMTQKELRMIGIYDGADNVEVLNVFDIEGELPEHRVISRNLDAGILTFLDAGNGLTMAYRIDIKNTFQQGEGSFWADTFGFTKRQRVLGYTFKGTILLVEGKVTYKFRHRGKQIDIPSVSHKPLGPIQHIGEATVKIADEAL